VSDGSIVKQTGAVRIPNHKTFSYNSGGSPTKISSLLQHDCSLQNGTGKKCKSTGTRGQAVQC